MRFGRFGGRRPSWPAVVAGRGGSVAAIGCTGAAERVAATGRVAPSVLAVLATLAAYTAPAAAQAPAGQDTVVGLDAIVVTADREQLPLASSIASVSVLAAPRLASLPQATLADALRMVPGFATVAFDGVGYDPQLMVRGFYGGGEAEYVVVMLDGRPLNDVQSGLVAWDAIPLAAVERVEIVRGASSALWGDAAIGGVINVITRERDGDGAGARWRFSGGSLGTWRGGADANGTVFGRAASVFAGVDRTEGYREHAGRIGGRAGGSIALASGPAGSVRLSTLTHWREFDEPGPLPEAELEADRTASDGFYRFDATEDRRHRIGLDADRVFGPRARLTGSLGAELREGDAVRTVVLAPGFADTKARDLRTGRVTATAQLSVDEVGLPLADRLVVGVDASYGTLDSKYYGVATGDAGAYAAATGERGALDTHARADRLAGALFAQYTVRPTAAVRLSLGARADWLRDGFDPRAPRGGEAGEGAAAEPADATHSAFSTRAGVNVRYLDRAGHEGRVYLTAGRSFKAPTLDQLYDQRRMPVPFPPFSVTTSNGMLEPQHGTSVEAGVYHRAERLPGGLAGELSVSVYRMDMRDELDFDLQTLRYVNIGRSRHRGIEAGLGLHAGIGSAFLNYTLQEAVSRVGENEGRYLKAIPRHTLNAGLTMSPVGRLDAGLLVSHVRGAFLDDANTLELPAYTRVDARVSHPVGPLRLYLDVRNLFDAEYSTTGFPDPAGTGVVYYHPAAGRTLEFGVRGG